MEYDEDKVDGAVLALLHLTTYQEGPIVRAWKGQNWDSMNRLFEREYIQDPKSKAKSVVLTEAGRKKSEELFRSFFGIESESSN